MTSYFDQGFDLIICYGSSVPSRIDETYLSLEPNVCGGGSIWLTQMVETDS